MKQCKFILSITFVSLLTCVLYAASLTTEHWLAATAVSTDHLRSTVNYGLFSGFVERHQQASTLEFRLAVVCSIQTNACMFSCQSDASDREDELKRVIRGQELNPCKQKRFHTRKLKQNVFHILLNTINFSKTSNPPSKSSAKTPSYISASLYMCCVMFLCLAFGFSLMSCFCSAINLKWHPVERIFNMFGLFVWNGIAVVCCFWSLAFWSALFSSELRYNIAITDTLQQQQQLKFTSEGYASLGYSYYLVIIIMVLHIINLVLLFVHNYSIDKEPHPNGVSVSDTDARLEFY